MKWRKSGISWNLATDTDWRAAVITKQARDRKFIYEAWVFSNGATAAFPHLKDAMTWAKLTVRITG